MPRPRTTRSGGSVVWHATLFPLASALPVSEPEESATRLPTRLTSSSPSHSLSFDRRRREILQRSAVDAILRGGLHRHPAGQDLLRRANHPCRQQGNTLHRGGSRGTTGASEPIVPPLRRYGDRSPAIAPSLPGCHPSSPGAGDVRDVPVLIVGGGPVGLALAADLGWRGWSGPLRPDSFRRPI